MRTCLIFSLLLLSAYATIPRRGKISDLPAHYHNVLRVGGASQLDQISGTNFLFAIPNSHLSSKDTSYTENIFLTVTNPSSSPASVTVSSSYDLFQSVNATIQPNSSQDIPIQPADIQTNYMDKDFGNTVSEMKAIYVTSSLPVSVVVSNFRSDGKGGDKFSVIPTCFLGTEYQMVEDMSGTRPFQANSTNIITVLAAQDNTSVTLTNLLTSQITLNVGETLTIATNKYFSTVIVSASKPVAVISGSVCGYGLVNPVQCNYESVMLYPTSNWGKVIPFFKFQPQDVGEVVIRFKDDYTLLQVDGQVQHPKPYYKDEYVILNSTTGLYLSANQSIYATGVGSVDNAGFGAPFFAHLPSDNLFIDGSLSFATGLDSDSTFRHFVRITTHVNNLGSVSVDGYYPNGLLYTRMGRGRYYYVDVEIKNGQHSTFSPAGITYSVTVYGYAQKQSYAFTPGLNLQANSVC